MAKATVPQKDGEILITRGGEVTRYKVTDHEVTVKEADLDEFLDLVPESKEVRRNSASAKEGDKN